MTKFWKINLYDNSIWIYFGSDRMNESKLKISVVRSFWIFDIPWFFISNILGFVSSLVQIFLGWISSWIQIFSDSDLLGIRSVLGLRSSWIQIFLDWDLLGFRSSVKVILLNCYNAYKCNSFLPVTFMRIFSNKIYLILSYLILFYLSLSNLIFLD